MAKYTFLIFFVFITHAVFAQLTVNIQWQPIKTGNTGDTIYYDANRKLTWSDFKGRPDGESIAGAITQSGFGYRMSMQSVNNRTTINIIVYCYFSKNRSWVKKGMKTDYALEHEQHHYDITYISTCLFMKKLKEAKLVKSTFASVVEKIYDDSFAALNKMQDEYDGETSNGRIERVQFAWNKKIDGKLAELVTD